MTSSVKGTLRLYGAGGAGINCISIFNNVEQLDGCASILTSYIDTSRSNIKPEFKEEDCFLLKGVDGSGKIRRENHKEISESIKKILLDHQPGDFNIVVSSASGGSGSIIAPLILSELLKRGESAVYCLIGSTECSVTATNTLNTLKSLDAIAERTGVPTVVFYEQNDNETPRSEIDKQVRYTIATIANLVSRQNEGLDTKDISNWVRFNYSTGVESQLALLDVFTDPHEIDKIKDPISIASLYNDPDQNKIKATPEYSCVGYVPNPSDSYDQIHMVISTDGLDNIYDHINKIVTDFTARREGRQNKAKLVSDTDIVTDDNLVL
jgi:hypothetical protein